MFEIPNDNKQEKSLYNNPVSIKSSLNGKTLTLKGVLSLTEFNNKDECQLFYFKKIKFYQPKKLQNAYILFNPQDKDKDKAFLSVSKDT